MTKITPLNNAEHSGISIIESNDFSRFSNEHLIPVLAQDFLPLATEFPIVFVKNTETGRFTPVAMMGLKIGVNLYCQDSSWHSNVTPLGFSNAPLSLMKTSEQSDEVMVCIDLNSHLVVKEGGHRLFIDSKEQSEYLKKRTQALLDIDSFNQQTANICQFLSSLKLLEPKQLSLKLLNNKTVMNIDGIYVIDKERLNDLSDEDFLSLKNRGILPLIYAHQLSLQQFSRLIKKQNQYDLSH
ncbi:SapC family protein [uncultured Shewanella sp.]|uniref:SapC family protein n=1 Tax=uncultured Shewanella sp. TaxID=173975 RepID=UPI0026098CC1|nr:SapC family protein [uncultured Shewanella sp.]